MEGVYQGCTYDSFLASLGLQPVLQEVAESMPCGIVVAYCDDVKLVGPPAVAHAAYAKLKSLCQQLLGLEEQPAKGSVLWEGEGAVDVPMLPPTMPGVASRLLFDRQLGFSLVTRGQSRWQQ